MTETRELSTPTKESILSSAKSAAEGLRSIAINYPQTANSLYEIRLHDGEVLDDAVSLMAKQLVMDNQFGGEQNAENLTSAIFDGRLKGIDTGTLQKALGRFEELAKPDQSREELLRTVQGEYNRNSVRLMQQNGLSVSHMKEIQARNRYLVAALNELRS